MPQFSRKSLANLEGVDPNLRALFEKVGATYNCTILEGFRDRDAQNAAFDSGRSQTPWPLSKHNRQPARAVDAAPWPVDWNDLKRFYHFAGYVMAIAHSMDLDIRWGGDWDSDFEFKDNSFNDLPHFELRGDDEEPV